MSNHERFVRRAKAKLGQATDRFFIGGIDWSFNEHKQQRHMPHWCLHVHGITVTNKIKVLRRSLKKKFPATDTIPRTIKVQEWDGKVKALRYPFKPKFDRRIGTENGKRFDKRTGKYRKCRDTNDQPLRSKDKLELLLHLDSIGIAGRLFVKSVQFMKLKGTGPTFRDTPSKARVLTNEG